MQMLRMIKAEGLAEGQWEEKEKEMQSRTAQPIKPGNHLKLFSFLIISADPVPC